MNIAFIPVRCGSKSIPFKNIKSFCGRPLIYWNLKALEDSKNIDKIYVATDCEKIKRIVSQFQFSKVSVFERSKENAEDKSSTESVMLEFLSKNKFNENDVFLLVQATSPLTQTNDFDNAIGQFKRENTDSLLSCVRTKRFFWRDDSKSLNYDYKNRPRRQDFGGLLMENGAFYISTVGSINRSKNRLSGSISIYEMAEYTAIEIDEEDDWGIAESLMNRYVIKKPCNAKIKLFLSDVDGTMTDAGMYYGENGEELKKFNTRDGKGFELLRKSGIKVGIITSENTNIVSNRAKKLKVDFLHQGVEHNGKLDIVKKICKSEKIDLENVAYIGDDVNCKELLAVVGFAACPHDAVESVKNIPNIRVLTKKGGCGVVREFIDLIIKAKN